MSSGLCWYCILSTLTIKLCCTQHKNHYSKDFFLWPKNRHFGFKGLITGIPLNLYTVVLYRKSCIQNISILWKATNVNTLGAWNNNQDHNFQMKKWQVTIFITGQISQYCFNLVFQQLFQLSGANSQLSFCALVTVMFQHSWTF